MAVYMVTWDLNREKANYAAARAKLIAHLQTYDHAKDPGLDSVWFISTSKSASDVSAGVQANIDKNDRCFVAKLVTGNYQGWLNKDVWDWINARLKVAA